MSIEASHDTPKSQLDAEIDEALAGSGEAAPVGYWPALPEEPTARRTAPRRARASKTSTGSSKKKVARKATTTKKARSKAKARPLKKKTARKASSRKPRARSTKKRTTKRKTRKTSKKSTAKKKAAKTKARSGGDGGRGSGGDLLSRVRSAVKHMGAAGRFGNKVFISEIYDKVKPAVSMPEFKRWLVDQNRERTLNLARADLVGAMDPGQVSRSEIVDMGSSFHFVIDPDYRYGYG